MPDCCAVGQAADLYQGDRPKKKRNHFLAFFLLKKDLRRKKNRFREVESCVPKTRWACYCLQTRDIKLSVAMGAIRIAWSLVEHSTHVLSWLVVHGSLE